VMDDRIRDRRQSLGRERGRRRAWIVLPVVVLVIVAGLFVWLRSSSVFAVTTVTATATERVSEEEISAATATARGVSLLKLSIEPIEKALAALPYVRSVRVYRDFPNTLEVQLVEYEPLARLRTLDGQMWLVSEDGRALERITPPRGYSLPLVLPANPALPVAGAKVSDEIVAALPVVTLLTSEDIGERLPDVKQVMVATAGEVTVALADGSELRLGKPTELERKLTVAGDIVQECLRNDEQVEYIDVSVPERVAVKAK
jgi:cell division protein FtsQ